MKATQGKKKSNPEKNRQEKRSHTQPKAKPKEQSNQYRQNNIHIHSQSRKPKTIPIKKKPRASCTRLRQFRRKRRNCKDGMTPGKVLSRYRDTFGLSKVTEVWKVVMESRFVRSVESRSMSGIGEIEAVRRREITMRSIANAGMVMLVCCESRRLDVMRRNMTSD
ncbi:hypothetical protein [uncultured Bifidobacterium sp.]|uniref:hypothetical protein n=1 Tax=uncultured Bifidobacterium sp. TaxID=165187 RepID=UPI00258ECFFA|nr:hypothetical protein [uncultured Bifidobacterium sp.]